MHIVCPTSIFLAAASDGGRVGKLSIVVGWASTLLDSEVV
jgi:hypothetical protein